MKRNLFSEENSYSSQKGVKGAVWGRENQHFWIFSKIVHYSFLLLDVRQLKSGKSGGFGFLRKILMPKILPMYTFLHAFHLCPFLFLVTSYLVVAVQSCVEWIQIKKTGENQHFLHFSLNLFIKSFGILMRNINELVNVTILDF